MKKTRVVVLGATGTIGKMSLDVLKRLGGFEVVGMSANVNCDSLLSLRNNFRGAKLAVTGRSDDRIDFTGEDSVRDLLEEVRPDTVVVGVSGFAGLRHALTASKYSKRLCLANKESIVAGGDFFLKSIADSGCELIPVDSEHNAVFQLLDVEKAAVDSITLTASGGGVRNVPVEKLDEVSPSMVLKHPVWNMGARITVDSATMFNKGLEVMEARFLFGFEPEKINVALHPEGRIHGMIKLEDGSVKAHISKADMRLPISYALKYPERVRLFDDFEPFGPMTLEKPDPERFPALYLAYECLRAGDGARVVYNAADEVAVDAFLEGKIPFTGIHSLVKKVLQEDWPGTLSDYGAIADVDAAARRTAGEMIG